MQADKKSCPTCDEAEFSVFADKRLRRSLYAFQVRCVHQKSGCEWTGELRELDKHLNINPELGKQLIGCAFAEVACTHCCEYFQRRHVHAHESESCPQRPFSCDYCEEYGSVYEDVVNNHWPVCKCYPVSCPNECGVSPERQNVETHVNTVCPLTVVNCDFHYAGCEVQLVRKDMPTHIAESLVTHLSLLALHNQQLTQLTIQQKESLEELKKENEVLKQKDNKDIAREVAELKESLEKRQLKIQELEREKQAQAAELQKCSETSKEEIEALKQKVNKDLKQEVAELQRQREEDRASLLQYVQRENKVLKEKVNKLGDVARKVAELKESLEKRQLKIQELEREKQALHNQQLTVTLQLKESLEELKKESQLKLEKLERENEVLKQKVNKDVAKLKENLEKTQLKIQELEKEKQAQAIGTTKSKHDALTLKVNGGLEREVAELRRQRDQDKALLLHQCPSVFPVELMITNFAEKKSSSRLWHSPPFYTHPQGYKMCLSVYANGCGEGKGTHVSVYAHLMRGEFDDHLKGPFQGDVTIAMLNQLEDNNHITRTIPFTKTTEAKIIGRGERASSGFGYHKFIAHAGLTYDPAKNCQYLKYDCLRFRIVKVDQPKVDIPSGLVKCIKSKFEMK